MNKVLFILPKNTSPSKIDDIQIWDETIEKPLEYNLIKDFYTYLSPTDKNTIKLFRGGAFEEFPLEEAQAKIQDVYNNIDYIVYQSVPVKEYLSNFNYMIDEFKNYVNPELGALYTDYYSTKSALKKHEFVRSYTPENFVQSPPPVVIVNKKYLPVLPLSMDQQVAMHLMNTSPIKHIPEATYII